MNMNYDCFLSYFIISVALDKSRTFCCIHKGENDEINIAGRRNSKACLTLRFGDRSYFPADTPSKCKLNFVRSLCLQLCNYGIHGLFTLRKPYMLEFDII